MNQKILHFSNKLARRAQKISDRWGMNYWHNFPFGTSPRADEKTYLKLWEEAKSQQYPEIDAFENENNISIDNLNLSRDCFCALIGFESRNAPKISIACVIIINET